jgi:hypothetical protein
MRIAQITGKRLARSPGEQQGRTAQLRPCANDDGFDDVLPTVMQTWREQVPEGVSSVPNTDCDQIFSEKVGPNDANWPSVGEYSHILGIRGREFVPCPSHSKRSDDTVKVTEKHRRPDMESRNARARSTRLIQFC